MLTGLSRNCCCIRRVRTRRFFAIRDSRSIGGISWCSSWPDTGAVRGLTCRPELELRPWRDEDLNAAARLIATAYSGHPDSLINDQYRSVHGSLRFLHNIVRYSGCGVFSAQVSHVVVDRSSRELVALVLGSRVSPQSGHITQLCVHPSYRRHGLARMLLSVAAAHFVRQGVSEISLTVTEANANAIELYKSEGYDRTHNFDAAVWERDSVALKAHLRSDSLLQFQMRQDTLWHFAAGTLLQMLFVPANSLLERCLGGIGFFACQALFMGWISRESSTARSGT